MPLRPLTEQEKLDIEFGRMLRRVAGNPKTRRDLYHTIKKAEPDTRWADQEIEDFKEQFKKEEEEKRIKRQAAEAQEKMQAQKAALEKVYDADSIKKIEALMEKHGIFDYELGAKLYNAEAPAPAPANEMAPGSSRWEMPSDKELIDNPAKWANQMAHKTIAEFRQARGLPGR